jgi:hypothetical protein
MPEKFGIAVGESGKTTRWQFFLGEKALRGERGESRGRVRRAVTLEGPSGGA